MREVDISLPEGFFFDKVCAALEGFHRLHRLVVRLPSGTVGPCNRVFGAIGRLTSAMLTELEISLPSHALNFFVLPRWLL